MEFKKTGPKRLRFTRRDLPHGQVRRWGATVGNFKAEREAKRHGLTGGARRLRIDAPAYPVQVHTREDRNMGDPQSAGPELAAWMGLVDEIREGFPEFNPTKMFILVQDGDGVIFHPPETINSDAEELA